MTTVTASNVFFRSARLATNNVQPVLRCQPNGDVDAQCYGELSDLEDWTISYVDPSNDAKVALRSHRGMYLTAHPDGSVDARAETIGHWETWSMTRFPDGYISFQSHHGKYLRCGGDEHQVGSSVVADAVDCQQHEKWIMNYYPDNELGSHESYFFGFLASTNLFELSGKKGVFFAGMPRAGKSTATYIQIGGNTKQDPIRGGNVTFSPADNSPGPKIAHGGTPKTINVTVYRDFRNNKNIIDPPGLGDDRSDAHRLWSNFSLSTSYALAESVEATCFVLNYQILSTDVRLYRDFAMIVTANSVVDESFLGNTCFLFTHVGAADHTGVMEYIENKYVEELTQKLITLRQLHANHPTIRGRLGHMGNGNWNSPEDLKSNITAIRNRIDFEAARARADSLQDIETLERISRSVQLLEAMLESRERVVLSKPSSKRACEKQRLEMDSVFEKCTTLRQSELTSLSRMRRGVDMYTVYAIFEQLALKMQVRLDTYVREASNFLSSLSSREALVRSIIDDWQAVRDIETVNCQTKVTSLQRDLVRLRRSNTKLSQSDTLKAPLDHIKIAQKKNDKWYAFLRLSTVEATVRFNGRYESIVLDPPGSFDNYDIHEENGETFVRVRSKMGKDLDTRVKFEIFERDTRKAIETIGGNARRIEEIEREMERQRDLQRTLVTVRAAGGLSRILVTDRMKEELDRWTEASRGLEDERRTNIIDHSVNAEAAEVVVQWKDACFGLYKMLDSLISRNALPTDIPAETVRVYNSFRDSYITYDRLRQRIKANTNAMTTVRGAEIEDVSNAISNEPKRIVNVDSNPGTSSDHTLYWTTVQQHLELTLGWIEKYPLEVTASLGIAILATALNLKPHACLGVFLISIAVCLAFGQAFYMTRRTARMEIESLKTQINHRLDEALSAGEGIGQEAAQQFRELRNDLMGLLDTQIEEEVNANKLKLFFSSISVLFQCLRGS